MYNKETYREHDWNSTADRLGAIQMSLLAQEQLLLSIGKLPGSHRGTEQVNSDGFAGGQGGLDLVLAESDGGLG